MALSTWEARWAPYDEPTYRDVLACIRSDDVVLEIGAGDLRLARRLAAAARRVYAVERQAALLTSQISAPSNLHVVRADARDWPFPADVTVGVLLMRHCTHVRLYAEKLAAVGCRRLITNARWGLGVESIDLSAPRTPYDALACGWYACRCGATGFVIGPTERYTPEVDAITHEVRDCPTCAEHRRPTAGGEKVYPSSAVEQSVGTE